MCCIFYYIVLLLLPCKQCCAAQCSFRLAPLMLCIALVAGAHESPQGRQGASNYVQRHAFPQVGNLPLWSLRVRVKHKQRTACRQAHERVLLFRARDANSRIVKILHVVQGSTMEPERGDSKNERLRKRKL